MPSGWRFMSPIERADLADFSYRPDADPFAIDIQSPVDRAGVNTIHHVVYDPVNKYVSCDCPAGQFRRNCWASEAYKVIFLPAILAALGEESVILIDGEIIEAKPLEREAEPKPNDKQAQIDAALAEFKKAEKSWKCHNAKLERVKGDAAESLKWIGEARREGKTEEVRRIREVNTRDCEKVAKVTSHVSGLYSAMCAARERYEALLPITREPDVMRKDDFD